MAKRDYYEVLGVEQSADAAAIKTAYRRLAMKFHPDRNAGDDTAEGKFKEVQEAYACLSDEQKRAAYDRFGHEAFDGGMGGGGGDPGFSSFFEDVFSDFFSGGGGGGRQQARRQQVLDISLTFEEMAAGCEKEIRINMPTDCEECNGRGAKKGSAPVTCSTCGGNGQVRVQRGVFTLQQACPTCRGAGQIIKNPCTACNGKGKVSKARHLQVNFPAGISDGALVRVDVKNNSNEELYIRPNIGKHPLFIREGDDVHLEIPISVTTAGLGGEIITPSVKGGKLEVKIPAGVQSGQVLRMNGGGLPNVRSGRRGNLLCHISVEVPINLNSEQKELLRKFEKSLKKNHSPKEQSWIKKAKQFFTE
ncbi:MAG: molecular chaperone DnaJ [Proteobacteria bacterium]|nr:molecular chaperone DnaJ [Pseudomonadota bacterium]